MPFRKGVSGNPKGRPPGGTSLAERIRQKGGEDGAVYVDLLHDIATNSKESTRFRIEAAKILLLRGFGSVPQEVDVDVDQPLNISADEIRRALDASGFYYNPPYTEASKEEGEQRVSDWLAGKRPRRE